MPKLTLLKCETEWNYCTQSRVSCHRQRLPSVLHPPLNWVVFLLLSHEFIVQYGHKSRIRHGPCGPAPHSAGCLRSVFARWHTSEHKGTPSKFWSAQCAYFLCVACASGVVAKKPLPDQRSRDSRLCFKSFILSTLTCGSMTYFELTFACGARQGSNVMLSHADLQLPQYRVRKSVPAS